MNDVTILGMQLKTVTIILLLLVLLLIVFVIFLVHQMNIMSRKYSALMSGKKGADLEKIIRYRFKEMDQIKANAKRVTKEHKEIKRTMAHCISKYSLIKYDAFEGMAGKLSFVIALLNENNSGIVFNAMHSREGCFTYAKEIIKGESFIPLSEEEKEAIAQAKTVDEEIDDLTKATNDDEFLDLMSDIANSVADSTASIVEEAGIPPISASDSATPLASISPEEQAAIAAIVKDFE